jgi:hypothetical protein
LKNIDIFGPKSDTLFEHATTSKNPVEAVMVGKRSRLTHATKEVGGILGLPSLFVHDVQRVELVVMLVVEPRTLEMVEAQPGAP